MATPTIYKVFVSSTYEDLREERSAVQKALLQLDCLPVGMELFPAADEETWNFITGQIDDSDYYVVLVAGRYGSLAADGVGFTEKEYDYALSRSKPAIGFIHGQLDAIPVGKTERTEEGRKKLASFLQKLRQRPVQQFTTPHELAAVVTTSFIQLIRQRPALGYVRSDQAVDFKRYAELLEENRKLKEQLSRRDTTPQPFPASDMAFPLVVVSKGKEKIRIECSLSDAFRAVAVALIEDPYEWSVLQSAASILSKGTADEFTEASIRQLRHQLVMLGLVEIEIREIVEESPGGRKTLRRVENTWNIWKLTDYGRGQLALFASRPDLATE